MSYYIVKVYGLVCDNCEASEETVPAIDAHDKLAAARRELSKPPSNWTHRDGKDYCRKCNWKAHRSSDANRTAELPRAVPANDWPLPGERVPPGEDDERNSP